MKKYCAVSGRMDREGTMQSKDLKHGGVRVVMKGDLGKVVQAFGLWLKIFTVA